MIRKRLAHPAFRLALVWAALLGLPGDGARADPRNPDQDLFLRPEDLKTVLFGSLDAGRSTFVSTGVKRSLTGPLDRPGFLAMETTGFGVTRERYAPTPGLGVIRLASDAATLLGYQWMENGVYVALFAGPELHHEQLSVAAISQRWSKPRIGARLQAELWANPTSDTLLTGTVVAGSTRGSLWARVSAGYRLWNDVFAGPEASINMTDTYRELKIGAHLTGISIGILNLRLSGGLQEQEDRHQLSPYVGLAGWLRL